MKKAYSKPTITLLTKELSVNENGDGDTEDDTLLRSWLEEGNAVKPVTKRHLEAFAQTDSQSKESSDDPGDSS